MEVAGRTGDLISLPDPAYRLVDQDIHGLMWAINHCPPGPEADFCRQIINDRRQMLEAELSYADPLLDAMLSRVNRQLRSRPDIQTGTLAVEQYIPSLHCWLVNGYFNPTTPYALIISALEAGDPTKRTAEEEIAAKRERAQEIRDANEEIGDEKVKDAVSQLGQERIENFVSVERALHTGENITVRGDDRRTIERLVNETKSAAERGDKEAQRVIKRGQRDNPTCVLPTTNPLRHRHRKELEASDGTKK